MANPSPVIFAGVLASKVRKIKKSDKASQRLVKHNIMISLYSFLKTCSICFFFILTAVGRFI